MAVMCCLPFFHVYGFGRSQSIYYTYDVYVLFFASLKRFVIYGIYSYIKYLSCVCTSSGVRCALHDEKHTQKEETLRAKEQKRLQRNKYNMMTFKYTEANSPTNLTINNAFLCSLRLCIRHSNKYGN